MEGDQEKPWVFKPSNSRAKIKSWQEVPANCPLALQDERTPPKLPFRPWGWVLMARGVVH